MARNLTRTFQRRARIYLESPLERVELRGRLLHPYWRYRFDSFGTGSVLHKPIWLQGAHKVAVGDHVFVMMCWLNVERRAWSRPGPAVSIGDHVVIRPFSTIAAAESVIIEDTVAIGSHCFVTDHEHLRVGKEEFAVTLAGRSGLAANPNVVSPLDTAPVRIGHGTWLGERVAVLHGSNIGRYCVIGTNSVVRGEIPDYSIAVGAPARVVGSTRMPDGERLTRADTARH